MSDAAELGKDLAALKVSHEYEAEECAATLDDEPYCMCDLDPIEEEMASMTCFCCGKEICP